MNHRELTNAARRLRSQLGMKVACPNLSLRQIAEHEAAHIVVGFQFGGECLFTHTGARFGQHVSPFDTDGVNAMVLPLEKRGSYAVAGMTWDKRGTIGHSDAQVLLDWLYAAIGSYPKGSPAVRDKMIQDARATASVVLHANSEAVMAVADVIERETSVWNGGRLKKVAAAHMTMPPSVMPLANHVWRSAVRGNRIAEVAVDLMGLTAYLAPVRKEMGVTLKSRAAL